MDFFVNCKILEFLNRIISILYSDPPSPRAKSHTPQRRLSITWEPLEPGSLTFNYKGRQWEEMPPSRDTNAYNASNITKGTNYTNRYYIYIYLISIYVISSICQFYLLSINLLCLSIYLTQDYYLST